MMVTAEALRRPCHKRPPSILLQLQHRSSLARQAPFYRHHPFRQREEHSQVYPRTTYNNPEPPLMASRSVCRWLEQLQEEDFGWPTPLRLLQACDGAALYKTPGSA